jgi:AraC-like DNA-binding protein
LFRRQRVVLVPERLVIGVPASELSNESVPLDALLPGSGELVERIQAALTIAEGLALVEDFLARRPFAADPLVERALRLLAADPGGAPLARVALEAGYYDQSHFIRELRRFAGMTPGELRQRAEMSDPYNRAAPGPRRMSHERTS